MKPHALALVAAALTGVLVGAAMVATKAVAADVAPVPLAFLRYAIGFAFLLVPLLSVRWPRYAFKDAAAVALLGVFQFAVLIVLVNYSLQSLPAAQVALVFSAMPLATLSLAILLGQEAPSAAKTVGILLAMAGVAVSLGPSVLGRGGIGTGPRWAAAAAIVVATIVGAACSVAYRPYLRRYAALPTSGLAMLASVVFLACFCIHGGRPIAPDLTVTQWLDIVFIGFSSGLGYYCWLWALGRLEPSRVVAFQALGPVTAALIDVVVQRRAPSLALCASILLVLSGLLIVQRARFRPPRRLRLRAPADGA